MKKKSKAVSKKASKKKLNSKPRKATSKLPSKAKSRIKTRNKMMKAADHIRKTTKKMVDDVFLKLVGRRVLERAEEVSRSLSQEKSGKKKRS
jgi:hypothetical protein